MNLRWATPWLLSLRFRTKLSRDFALVCLLARLAYSATRPRASGIFYSCIRIGLPLIKWLANSQLDRATLNFLFRIEFSKKIRQRRTRCSLTLEWRSPRLIGSFCTYSRFIADRESYCIRGSSGCCIVHNHPRDFRFVATCSMATTYAFQQLQTWLLLASYCDRWSITILFCHVNFSKVWVSLTRFNDITQWISIFFSDVINGNNTRMCHYNYLVDDSYSDYKR